MVSATSFRTPRPGTITDFTPADWYWANLDGALQSARPGRRSRRPLDDAQMLAAIRRMKRPACRYAGGVAGPALALRIARPGAIITAMERPLFLVLKHRWFDAFADGSKRHEWRPYGPRFNERTCTPGRAVILLRGYTRRRLSGVIASFSVEHVTEDSPAASIYDVDTPCAVIGITFAAA
jgi:hypothetical protein